MADLIDDMLRDTTEVMTELTAKAKEAVNTGTSRRDFFARTATLAGATVLGSAGAGLLQPIAAAAATRPTKGNNDTLQEVINLAATAESLAVTFYYQALENVAGLPDVNNAANRNYFQAALTQEFEQLQILKQLGAVPVTEMFYFPPGMFTDESVFFPTAILLEEYFISAYLAAALDFSGAVSTGIPTAFPFGLGFAVQVLGVECEHKALLGVAANITPPNSVIIETALLKTVMDAVKPLTPFLDGADGFVGPVRMPKKSVIETTAAPYGSSFFPKYKIV